MEFAGFNWDAGNRKKCQKHGVSIAEIESVFSRPVVILRAKEIPKASGGFWRLEPALRIARYSWCLPCATSVTVR